MCAGRAARHVQWYVVLTTQEQEEMMKETREDTSDTDQSVLVSGVGGYEDFNAEFLWYVRNPENHMMCVVRDSEGEYFVFPAKNVFPKRTQCLT